MHAAVLSYVGRWATTDPIRILDIGGRDVNGTPRHLFPNAHYLSIDKMPGPGVDLAMNVTEWDSPIAQFDLILCLEVLEHCRRWYTLLRVAYEACLAGGHLIITCAGPGRAIHSEVDGGPTLHAGEEYENIYPGVLSESLYEHGWDVIECFQSGEDVRAMAVKPS